MTPWVIFHVLFLVLVCVTILYCNAAKIDPPQRLQQCGDSYCQNDGKCVKTNCSCRKINAGKYCELEVDHAPVFENVHFSPVLYGAVASKFKLECNAYGRPEPIITWLKNSKPIKSDEVEKKDFVIKFKPLWKSHSGNYTCIVENSLGSINRTQRLDATERFPIRPIMSDAFPYNITAEVGENVTFQCRVFSDLFPFVRWIIHVNETTDLKVPSSYHKDGQYFLVLENVTFKDAGKYTCTAHNSVGESKREAWLKVIFHQALVGEESDENQFGIGWILLGLGIMFISVCLTSTILIIWFRLCRKKPLKIPPNTIVHKRVVFTRQVSNNMPDDSNTPLVRIEYTQVEYRNLSQLESEYEMPEDPEWEIPRETLLLGKPLGHGAFGQVVQAVITGFNGETERKTVAVKMLKDGHTDEDMANLASEMQMMKLVGKHPNIINLLGTCSQTGPLYVIVEFAANGNLKDFLRNKRFSSGYEPPKEMEPFVITELQLVSFAQQVARGMNYLISRQCIHRDLAARNVLVMDDLSMKIADFGFAKDVHETYYYRKERSGLLPVKWMAIEALEERIFTPKTDVWAFGVLLWEIMTLGGLPYSSVDSLNLLKVLMTGYRLEKPKNCSLGIYKIMRACWERRPDDRPTFSQIIQELDKVEGDASEQDYLALFENEECAQEE